MPHACIFSQWRPPYNGHRFADGFKRLGFEVDKKPPRHPQKGDVLLLWNRHSCHEQYAKRYEAVGGRTIVAENGYFGRNWRGSQWYALALNQHNGGGQWSTVPGRWQSFGVDLAPWRTDGHEIVVLAQRGIGSDRVKEPRGWSAAIVERLQQRTGRKVRIRRHPGAQATVPKVSLEDDLRDAYAAVTWGSGAAIKALALGCPVFHGLDCWIGAPAASPLDHDLEDRFLGDRGAMFERLASAMWSIEEIESGDAFRCLLT